MKTYVALISDQHSSHDEMIQHYLLGNDGLTVSAYVMRDSAEWDEDRLYQEAHAIFWNNDWHRDGTISCVIKVESVR